MKKLVLIGLILALAAPASAANVVVDLTVTEDTFIKTYEPDANYGGPSYINLDPTRRHIGLLRWDNLPGDLAGQTVVSAVLSLITSTDHASEPDPGGLDNYLDVYQITDTAAWWEGTGTDYPPGVTGPNDGATWLYADHDSVPWSSPWNNDGTGNPGDGWGGQAFGYDTTSLDQQLVGTTGDHHLDVSVAVQNWADGQLNNGLVLAMSGGSAVANRHLWYTKDYCPSGDPPILYLEYTPEPATLFVLALGAGLALLRRR